MLNSLAAQFVGLMAWTLRILTRTPVGEISTERILEIVSAPDADDFVIVDVRSDAEIAVSLIPSSMSRAEFEASIDEHRNHRIIAYCTVGGRSLLYAWKLNRRGFDCRNYRDGILGWCSTGQPLVRPDGEPTAKVHTHNRFLEVPADYDRHFQRSECSVKTDA